MRSCLTCQHIKRPEIDRRLAAGEPLARVAPDYGLTTSSLYRHRTNCLKIASSNAIAKDGADHQRGAPDHDHTGAEQQHNSQAGQNTLVARAVAE